MDWLTESNSSEIDSIAQDIATSQAGLILLETQEWILPVAVISVEFTLSAYRRYNIIEEFIMKCISSGLSDLRSQQGISGLLKLDEFVVGKYLIELLRHHLLIEREVDGRIFYELSSKGQETCRTGLISDIPQQGIAVITSNAQYELIDTCLFISDTPVYTRPDLPVFRYFNQQEERALRSDFQLTDEEEVYLAKEQIKKMYAADLGDLVIVVSKPQLQQEMYRRFGEIWLYDVIHNQVICRVWDFWQNKFCEKLSFALNSLEAEHRMGQVQKVFSKDICITPTQPGILETLYGPSIRKAFLQAFNDVREIMLIVLPCISELVADDEVLACFQDVVSRKGSIYIGWGMVQTISIEEEIAAPALLEKLQSIVDPEGAPGVFLFYLGNHCNKEVLVDHQYHLLGSLKWLSYRGEHIVQNRVGARISDERNVIEHSARLQGLFLKQLEAQLIEGCTDDELKCITWFYALLGLNEHNYIRETLAEEALEKLMVNYSTHALINLLSVYINTDEYELGFTRLLERFIQKASNTELAQWLEIVYFRNPKAYSIITTNYKDFFN
ncbi:MAG: hypothetical protein K0R55_1719 [Sporomusa sp.]|nr:hypothetical protein [Sporomusa sp.]